MARAGITLAGVLGITLVLGLMLTAQTGVAARGTEEFPLPALAGPATGQPPPPAAASPASEGASVRPGRQAIKNMLYRAAVRHGVSPALVMGVAWWESGWDQAQVSSTGAIGIMQVEPYTADSAGPLLLHKRVDIHEAEANVDLGAAILRANLEQYHGNLVDALVAYYAGPSAVGDWGHLDPGARRYVLGVYSVSAAIDRGQGPA